MAVSGIRYKIKISAREEHSLTLRSANGADADYSWRS
jgi:hypothetical protein